MLAAVQLATVTAPSVAWAQAQPVPYPTLPAPVPYGEPTPPAGASVQRAPSVGQDVIYMKNGGILRGTIIDAIPDAQARIQLATGEIATVPWQAIDRIEHGNSGSGRPAPPAPLPAPPPAPGPGAPRVYAPSAMVWVHIEGADGATLEMDRGRDGTWENACRAPCDIQVPVTAEYRIGGAMLKQSGVFSLRGQQGDRVTVNVSGGSKAWLVVGIVITPVAGLVTLVAALVGLAGSVSASAGAEGCYNGSCAHASGDASNAATVGWVTALIGAAVTVGGIILIANNAKTGVTVDLTGAQAARVQGDAWTHVPSWRESGSAEKAVPPVFGGTLWTGHF